MYMIVPHACFGVCIISILSMDMFVVTLGLCPVDARDVRPLWECREVADGGGSSVSIISISAGSKYVRH